MHTSIFEEEALTDNTIEPQPETPSTPEPETTALVPTEPDVIEGEVIELEPPESTEDRRPTKQKPYWLLIPLTIFLCLLFLAGSFLVPLFMPSATVTIIPVERTITMTAAIQVPGRAILPLTLMQNTTVPATGNRDQDATRATGTITFYNGLLTRQTIAAGTMVTGSDGVQVITDQAATIPAGNPPIYGQVTIPAHAVLTGESGNIPAYDINTACCATSVVAKNTKDFSGGQSQRDFVVVTRSDINTVVTSLLVTLSQSENAALQAQLRPGEALITQNCTPHVFSDHKAGDEAKDVSVTVSETCTGIAYSAHTLTQDATQLFTSDAIKKLGAHYTLFGDIHFTISHATAMKNGQQQAQMLVEVTGILVYQFTPTIQQQLIKRVAGKTKQQAVATLLSQPGIQGAQITTRGGNQTLPQNPGNITIVVVYRSASL
jgi:hypothetical protein